MRVGIARGAPEAELWNRPCPRRGRRLVRQSGGRPIVDPAAALARLGRRERDVFGLRALRALGGLELHLRALGERLVALADDRAVVDEQVLTALVGGDEPVPLVGVEPLHGSSCHKKNTSSTAQERAEEAQRAHPVLAQIAGERSSRSTISDLKAP